jgi:quercetin dioxygenase-like cupin family protein
MTQGTYPRTIDNGAGERLTFLGRTPGARGERLEAENAVSPGAGPPMHAHLLQSEILTVRAGRMGHQRAGEPARFAESGETVLFAPGEPHRFWNAGEGELRVCGYIEPADNAEFFLTELYAIARAGRGRPNILDVAFLLRRYRSEFVMYEIPASVQRFVFPLLVAVGHVLGRYRKYSNAPPPTRRTGANQKPHTPAIATQDG